MQATQGLCRVLSLFPMFLPMVLTGSSLPLHFFLHQWGFLCLSWKQTPSWNTYPRGPVIPLTCFNFLQNTQNYTCLLVYIFHLFPSVFQMHLWEKCYTDFSALLMTQTNMTQDFQFLLSLLPLGTSFTNLLPNHSPLHTFFPDLITHFLTNRTKIQWDKEFSEPHTTRDFSYLVCVYDICWWIHNDLNEVLPGTLDTWSPTSGAVLEKL